MTVLVDARCLRLIEGIVPLDAEFCPLPVPRCGFMPTGRRRPGVPSRSARRPGLSWRGCSRPVV
jgi:hypothetical protein